MLFVLSTLFSALIGILARITTREMGFAIFSAGWWFILIVAITVAINVLIWLKLLLD